jgi:hypothetical protein
MTLLGTTSSRIMMILARTIESHTDDQRSMHCYCSDAPAANEEWWEP